MDTLTRTPSSINPFIQWFAPLWDQLTWKRSLYLLGTFPLGQFWFIVSVTMLAAGIGLLIVWVGVFILAALLVFWRFGARAERLLANNLGGVEIATPYRPFPDQNLLSRGKTALADPATWRDGLYLLLLFPLGIAWLVVQSVLWGVTVGLLASPLFIQLFETDFQISGGRSVWEIDTMPEAIVAAIVGIALLPLVARIVRTAGHGQALIAKGLLGPTKSASLNARVEDLEVTVEKGLDTADADRKRIERDLHDGAQQRLVALAMELGRAKEKLDEDHEARPLVDEAHDQAKIALSELRDLARGIHPAVLTDRGLDPALSALAARSPIPVEVSCDLDRRLRATIESTAYFVVSEALTNVTKHANASSVRVNVRCDDDVLIVEIIDDGVGSAIVTGSGLSGLSDRLVAVGGSLSVTSPAGGPTMIKAAMPCE